MNRIPGGCSVCDQVAPSALVELDLLMGDASRWPSSVWDKFAAPAGLIIPPAMRRWGAARLGLAWLQENGYADIGKSSVYHHYEKHTPVIAVDPDKLVENGVLVSGGGAIPDPAINPIAYLRFYAKGIEAGIKGLELLMAMVKELEEKDQAVPLSLIKLLTDIGGKLATSQAQIKAREKSIGTEDDDEGFRAGAGGLPSDRMGHARIRTVGGVSGPIHDEGPKDRAAYNDRAAQEGGDPL